MEKMKLFELPRIAQLERDQDQPIKVIMEGLVLGRHILEDAEAQTDYFLQKCLCLLVHAISLTPLPLRRRSP